MISNTSDDAYIHFRIVRNFVTSGYPYYNINEPVMSTSSPAWTLLLSALFIITGLSISHVAVLNALFVSGGMVIFPLIYSDKLTWFKKSYCVIYGLIYGSLIYNSSIMLMETPFCLFIVGCGLLLLSRKRPEGFFFLGLCIFIRYELSVIYGIVLLTHLIKREMKIHKIIFFSSLSILPLMIFQFNFYSVLIPNTINAKSIVYDIDFLSLLIKIVTSLKPQALPLEPKQWFLLFSVLFTLALILLTLGFCFSRKIRSKFVLKPFALDFPILFSFSGFIVAVIYLYKKIFLFQWYEPIYTIPIILGTIYTISKIKFWKINLLGLMVGVSFGVGIFFQIHYALFTPLEINYDVRSARVKAYITLGEKLYKEYPEKTLLTSEIGGLGWSFKGKIVDAVGLVSPNSLLYHPMPYPQERSSGEIGSIPPNLVHDLKPDIIVSYSIFIESFLRNPAINDYIQKKLPLFLPEDAKRFPDGIWGSQNLYLFIRKD